MNPQPKNTGALTPILLCALIVIEGCIVWMQFSKTTIGATEVQQEGRSMSRPAVKRATVPTPKITSFDLDTANVTEGTEFLRPATPIGRRGHEFAKPSEEIARRSRALAAGRDSAEKKKLDALNSEFAMESRYGPILRDLGLSDQQFSEVLTLINDREHAREDVAESFEASRTPSPVPTSQIFEFINAATKVQEAKVDEEIAAKMGADSYQRFVGYRNNLAKELVIEQLHLSLLGTGHELEPVQRSKISQLFSSSASTEKRRALIPVPNDSRAGTVRKDQGAYVQVAANSLYVNEDGSVFSNATIPEDVVTKAKDLMSREQADKWDKILAQQRSAKILSEGYEKPQQR